MQHTLLFYLCIFFNSSIFKMLEFYLRIKLSFRLIHMFNLMETITYLSYMQNADCTISRASGPRMRSAVCVMCCEFIRAYGKCTGSRALCTLLENISSETFANSTNRVCCVIFRALHCGGDGGLVGRCWRRAI